MTMQTCLFSLQQMAPRRPVGGAPVCAHPAVKLIAELCQHGRRQARTQRGLSL